ncbi:MAG: acetyl-CoA decarbonylase/synthase complex subunit alpha/beta, partial [Planctomycetota bacterium]
MSKIIASAAIRGAHKIAKQADDILAKAINEKGEDCQVQFPNTGYYIPIIYSMTGRAVEKLADFKEVMREIEGLLPPMVDDDLWVPYLGHTLDAGMATLFAEEIIEACKYLVGPNPVDDIWLGAADDVIMRERGIQFVDGTAPGFAAIAGAAPDVETAVEIARKLQERCLYVFMSANHNGTTFAEQLVEGGVQLGWETRLVPFGREITSAIYSLGFASRAALSFGGVQAGDFRRNLIYNKNRIFAFVMALGEVSDEWYATAAGAINYGFPTIADSDIPEILPTGVCTYEHVVSQIPHDQIVEKAVEVRGLKVKITEIPIPISVSPAFEGERIRKDDMQCEFGGQRTPAFEWLRMRDIADVEDGKVEVVGPDIDSLEVGGRLPLGVLVEVAGRKMQSDFEPVLERQVHTFINEAQGLWHMGQRDINWI